MAGLSITQQDQSNEDYIFVCRVIMPLEKIAEKLGWDTEGVNFRSVDRIESSNQFIALRDSSDHKKEKAILFLPESKANEDGFIDLLKFLEVGTDNVDLLSPESGFSNVGSLQEKLASKIETNAVKEPCSKATQKQSFGL